MSTVPPDRPPVHPCLHCGACCSHFRVSFYWAEGEGIPTGLTEPVTPVLACMTGTNQAQPRCLALQGRVGERVHCSIYEQRPSPCRAVQPGDAQCLKARRAFGLPALAGL